MASLMCPHCWNKTQEKELYRRCPQRCDSANEDTEREWYPAGQKLCPHGRPADGDRYHRCPKVDPDRDDLEPWEYRILEYDYITTKSRIVAMIGSSESGKSTFIGVLINEFRNRMGSVFPGMATDLVGDKSRDRYRRVFKVPMYEQGETVQFTNTVRAAYRLDPLLVMVRRPKRVLFREGLSVAMLVFFDTAGEDVLKDENIDNLINYLDAAEAIVVMIDPLQIRSVRRDLDDGIPIPKSVIDQVEIVQRLGELLRRKRRLNPTQKISTPIAVTVGKTDALASSLLAGSAIHRRGRHDGVYNEADGQEINDEMRAVLSAWDDGQALLNVVDTNFSDVRFFGVSALGVTPPSAGVISPLGIQPHRVEDPLLWLLSRFGLVDVRKVKR